MSAAEPLSIRVFDKAFTKKGDLGGATSVVCTLRHNAVGSTTVTVASSHRLVPQIMASGARCVITDEFGEHVTSGYIKERRSSGPAVQSSIDFDIEDDFAELGYMLGWVVPGGDITEQGTAGENWEMTGPAETVLKAAVTANATRLGKPIVCAPDLGRGATVSAKLRFHPLFDRLFPVVDGAGISAAGIGVTVRQVDDHLEVDCYEPAVYPRDLTEEGGAVQSWNWTQSEATTTRVVIGGAGTGIYRVLRTMTDDTLEASMGRSIERFRDDSGELDAEALYVAGQETLDDGKARAGLSLVLSETPSFHPLRNVHVGDTLTINVGPGVTVTDALTEVTLNWNPSDGWKTTPKVGDVADSTDIILAQAINRLARALSNSRRT